MDGEQYEEVEHTADWALRVRGTSMAELCQVAASAMLAACGARGADGSAIERSVHLEALDGETLLIKWLEEVLYIMEARNRMPIRIDVDTSPSNSLNATWAEVPLTGIDKLIKAVTFHDLVIGKTEDGLEATIVFDV